MNTVAIIQARMTSSRLPGKVLRPLGAGTVLDALIARLKAAKGIDMIAVAVPEGPEHDEIPASLKSRRDVTVTRGSETNVLSRYLIAARMTNADVIVRVTSDCPLIDPKVISVVVSARYEADVPFASTALESGYPIGFDVEAITRGALETAASEARDPYELEHVTPFVWRRPDRFPAIYIDRKPDMRSLRLAVDTPEDYELVRNIWKRLGSDPLFSLESILALQGREPELFAINASIKQTPYVNLKS